MLTFVKDDQIKHVDPESTLIQRLKDAGWKQEGDEEVEDDLEAIRAKAEALGIKVHHKAKAETILKAIADHDNAS